MSANNDKDKDMDIAEISRALTMRLQYANLKVQLGWADRTLADVEYTYHKRFPYRRQSPVVPMLDAYVQQQQQRQRRAMASKPTKTKISKKTRDTSDRGHRRRHKKKSIQRQYANRLDGKHDIGLSYADFWRSQLDHSRIESSPLGITVDEDAVLSHLGAQSHSQSQTQSDSQPKSESHPDAIESTATTGLGLSNSMQEDLAQMIAVHNANTSRSQEQEEHDFHQFVAASPMVKTPTMASAPLTPPASSSPHAYNVPTTPKRQMVLPTTPPPSSSTKLTFTPSLPTPLATPTSVPQ